LSEAHLADLSSRRNLTDSAVPSQGRVWGYVHPNSSRIALNDCDCPMVFEAAAPAAKLSVVADNPAESEFE
jgi:hypothetical protein